MRYNRLRTTGDLDYIEIVPRAALEELQAIAGRGSQLARQHALYFQHVGIASLPDSYEERLTPLFADSFERLRLFGVEAHDLALSKLARNSPVDREDVASLAKTAPLHPTILQERYKTELRPIIMGDVNVHDQTLTMWIKAYFDS